MPLNTNLIQIPILAKKLAVKIKGGETIALIGPLGSGKTTFAKALGKELKIKHKITSPTFTIMNSFQAILPKTKVKIFLYHLDLYRTKNFKEVEALGLTEIWGSPNTITLIEWADKIKKNLPRKTITIIFNNNDKIKHKA